MLYNLKILIKYEILGFWHGKYEVEEFESKLKQSNRLLNLNTVSELQNLRKNES